MGEWLNTAVLFFRNWIFQRWVILRWKIQRNIRNITSKGILIAGAYGGTEIFRKFSNINNLQCGQVVCYIDIPLFGQLFFGDSRPFPYPNSSVVSRGKIRIFFR